MLSTTSGASRSTAATSSPARTRITGARRSTRDAQPTEALDRDALLERLHQLRTVLPAFAQELADVRRAAAKLRVDNRRLLEQVHRLQRERGESPTRRIPAG